jgi:hypothetical protein
MAVSDAGGKCHASRSWNTKLLISAALALAHKSTLPFEPLDILKKASK